MVSMVPDAAMWHGGKFTRYVYVQIRLLYNALPVTINEYYPNPLLVCAKVLHTRITGITAKLVENKTTEKNSHASRLHVAMDSSEAERLILAPLEIINSCRS